MKTYFPLLVSVTRITQSAQHVPLAFQIKKNIN